jgi:3-hydroxyisobutyrate dehydrogenase
MGMGVARSLLRAGFTVAACDIRAEARAAIEAAGGTAYATPAEVGKSSAVVITLVVNAEQTEQVLFGPDGAVETLAPGSVVIASATVPPEFAVALAARLAEHGLLMLDAPVSGGVGGATAATLTFMVGGSAQAFTRAESILQKMGKTIVHAGGAGNGQAAKICNNMILGVSMIAVSEAFVLAEKLGLDHQKLFDISSKSSGQCWSMTTYCPVPGPVPTSPANRDYQAGFTAAMMLKDLKLSQEAAKAAGAKTQLGADAARIYSAYVESGEAGKDFSGIIRFVRG